MELSPRPRSGEETKKPSPRPRSSVPLSIEEAVLRGKQRGGRDGNRGRGVAR